MTKDEALRLALDALDCIYSPLHVREIDKVGAAMSAIKQALEQPEQEPDYYGLTADHLWMSISKDHYDRLKPEYRMACYTAPPKREPLTKREIELLDGMIEAQTHHAKQCDGISNRTMAEKQKCWDMERVALLQKLKAAHGIKGEA